MRGIHFRKPSPALVIACVALFSSLTGAAVAAVALADNSVLSRHIKNGEVRAGDLAGGSVNSAKVADRSLRRIDFKPNAVLPTVIVERTDVALPDNSTASAEAVCPSGTRAIGGGASVDETSSDDIKLLVSRPGNGGLIPADGGTFAESWRVVYRNPTGGTAAANIRAFALCAKSP